MLRVLLLPLVADPSITAPSLVGVDSGVKIGSIGLITPGDVCMNELLSFIAFYRDRSSAEYLHKTVGGFFTAGEIPQAKKVFIHKFLGLVTCYRKT